LCQCFEAGQRFLKSVVGCEHEYASLAGMKFITPTGKAARIADLFSRTILIRYSAVTRFRSE
jgi:hypothetical protein